MTRAKRSAFIASLMLTWAAALVTQVRVRPLALINATLIDVRSGERMPDT